ncbi:MAG: hypothetical protein B9S34_13940 [Opitutia bacterium Tous-C1TDCM]|nr:MAG: hypothetical protein B9S34_13940 [Opitutae bacterium Tous-C1TDCM]
MIPRLQELLADRRRTRRLGLLALAGAAAVAVGFKLVPPATIERLIVHGGYYFILAVFAAWCGFAWRVAAARREAWQPWLRRPTWVLPALVAAAAFAVWTDDFAHKVLFDEYVLQGTAWHMHATKEVGAPIRAYEFEGTWLAIDTFLDKRPYFFTFLVSLLHDLTGYRLENAYVLNVMLAYVTLGLTYWLAHALTGRRGPALLAVGLLASLPVFGQNASGASMEMHNLAMIAAVLASAVLYLRAPDDDRLSLLVLGAVLLAQCRYESVSFVAPVALVIVLGWWRCGRLLLPWPAVAAPLLLIPYAWLDRFVQSKPLLWQLREGETARFAWHYLAGNLEGARNFFFNTSPGQPNSLVLTVLGLAGAGWAAVALVRRIRRGAAAPPAAAATATLLFGLTVAGNLGLLMFYYWARLDELITARFALPFYFMLALLAAWAVRAWEVRRIPALRIAGGALALWLVACGAQAYARRFYTTQNLVLQELRWELDEIRREARGGRLLVVTNKATIPYLLERISAVNTALAQGRAAQIKWHLEQGTFRDIVTVQVLRPTSAQGDVIVAPDDRLPDSFKLQPIAQKRFGGRWIRLSRVTAIDVAAAPAVSGQP